MCPTVCRPPRRIPCMPARPNPTPPPPCPTRPPAQPQLPVPPRPQQPNFDFSFFQNAANLFEQFFNSIVLSQPAGQTALQTAGQNGNFSTLNSLVGTAGLTEALTNAEGQGPVTILAPTNAAFEALPADVRTKLQNPANQAALQEILQYHVSGQRTVPCSQGTAFNSLLADDRDKITVFGNAFQPTLVNNGTVVQSAGRALGTANGSVIIPINQVLIPPGLDLSKLV